LGEVLVFQTLVSNGEPKQAYDNGCSATRKRTATNLYIFGQPVGMQGHIPKKPTEGSM